MKPTKSSKASFIIKFVLLFPLSLAMIFVAMWGTGGGHGNFFPLKVIMGPMVILFFLSGAMNHDLATMCAMLGTACLYPAYALLLYFVKARILPVILAVIHIVCVAIQLFQPDRSPKVTEPFSLTLLAIIVFILISIRNNSLKTQKPASTPE